MYYFCDKMTGSISCEPNSVDECLEMIIDLGLDCDGCKNDSAGLEHLIGELVDYAMKARKYLKDGALYSNAAAEAWYYQEANRQQSEYVSKIF